jgi:hypothetical protein
MKKNKPVIDLQSVKLGSDPEIFVFNPLENRFETAIGLTRGSKEYPEPITDEGHCIQVDGVALEFNIPACSTKEEYVKNINFVKSYLQETILTPKGWELSKMATADFTDKQLNCKQAQEIGCDPDINAWSLVFNDPQGYKNNMRAVGGHIHVGYNNPQEDVSLNITKAMDIFLGVPSVLLDPDTRRRELYGKAGAMRFKPFGMEYRVLSNFWIMDDTLIKWVFNNTLKALDFVNSGCIITNPDDIVKCINTCDKELAAEIVDDYNIVLPDINVEELILS